MKMAKASSTPISKVEKLEKQLEAYEKEIYSNMTSLEEETTALRERKEIILERKKDLMERHGGTHVSDCDIIVLNVSGTEMFVRRDTITAVKDSMLEALFSGRWENQLTRDSHERVFIEADPLAFRNILEYLYTLKFRTPILPHIESTATKKNFDIYFNFFCLRRDDALSEDIQNIPDLNFTNGLKALIESEETIHSKIRRELDEIETQLEFEESFVKSFVNLMYAKDIRTTCSSQDSLSLTGVECEEFSINSSNNEDESPSNVFDEDLGILNLLVGGQCLVIKRSTLCLDPTSTLAKQFSSDKWLKERLVVTEEGKRCFLVEEPLNCFEALLHQLHLKSIGCDKRFLPSVKFNQKAENCMYEEIVNYYFHPSSDVIQLVHFRMDSVIIDSFDHEDKIEEFLRSVNRNFNLTLLYRASRDNFRADDFHKTCDGRGPTLTLIKSTKGFIIGGFADKSWSSLSIHIKSKQAFLFYLRCHACLPPAKLAQNTTSSSCNTLASNSFYGPTFGASNRYGRYKYDLCVSSSSNGTSCFVNIGNHYSCPDGYGPDFLTGKDHFDLDLIEVFKV